MGEDRLVPWELERKGRKGPRRSSATKLVIRLGIWRVARRLKITYLFPWLVWTVGVRERTSFSLPLNCFIKPLSLCPVLFCSILWIIGEGGMFPNFGKIATIASLKCLFPFPSGSQAIFMLDLVHAPFLLPTFSVYCIVFLFFILGIFFGCSLCFTKSFFPLLTLILIHAICRMACVRPRTLHGELTMLL